VNFFKYNKQANFIYNNKDENKLSYSFKILIEQLWPDGQNNKSKKYYAPHDFKEKISKMNPLFEGIQANDSKDLVNFIVMTLHEELNKANSTNNNLTDSINIDQRNKDLVFSVFIKNFTETNQSIISDIFYGVHCSITQCQNCKTISYNYQTYFFLIFPLEEVRKFKISNLF
jgi:ubiquitin C-terminal hydrolase